MISIGQHIEWYGMHAVVVARVVDSPRVVNLVLSFGFGLLTAVAEKEVIRMAERVTVSIVGDAALAAAVADALSTLAAQKAGTYQGDGITLELVRVGRFYNVSPIFVQSLYNSVEMLYNDATARQVSPFTFLWRALSLCLPADVVTLIRTSYNALNVAQTMRGRKPKHSGDQLRF